jgi:signal peptidase I
MTTDLAITRRRKFLSLGRIGMVLLYLCGLLGFAVVLPWALLYAKYNIPAESGEPNLLVGDYVQVSRLSYGATKASFPLFAPFLEKPLWSAPPQRGDIAVFKLPRDGRTEYTKRVIGLPGERVQMIEGRLYINGALVEREAVPAFVAADAFGRPHPVPTYVETLPGGLRHLIIERDGDRGPLDNTPVFEVPQEHYFVMGDNRDNSVDSRIDRDTGIGFVPLENFIGKVSLIYFSRERSESKTQSGGRIRWERLFRAIE